MTSAAKAESRVRAHVDWLGQCGESEALNRELALRGVALDPPSEADAEPAFTLSVSVSRVEQLQALLTLSDPKGRVQERHVAVESCEELRAVVAWVLLVLAREGRVPTESRVAEASAAFGTDESPPAPAQSAAPIAPPPAPPTASEAPTLRSAPTAPRRTPATFTLGSSFVAGFGLLPSPALGPAIYAQVDPGVRSRFALRASAFYLSTVPYERDGTNIGVTRMAAQFALHVRSGWAPLSLVAAIEAGRLTGSGTGTSLRSGSASALWLAAELGPRLRLPLAGDVLAAELGAALAFAPLAYSLQFQDGQALSRSEMLEVRGLAGLGAKLP